MWRHSALSDFTETGILFLFPIANVIYAHIAFMLVVCWNKKQIRLEKSAAHNKTRGRGQVQLPYIFTSLQEGRYYASLRIDASHSVAFPGPSDIEIKICIFGGFGVTV